MLKKLEELTGRGIVSAPDGSKKTVAYEIQIFEEQTDSTTRDSLKKESVSGLKSLAGRVDFCFGVFQNLTLTLQDGKKLPFVFTKIDGTIGARGWFTSD
jgi:hypothetical protein